MSHLLNILKEFWHTDCLKHFYRNELDNASFAQDAEYSNCKDLAKRAIRDNYLNDGSYEIARNCKYDGYQRTLATSIIVQKIFDKKIGLVVNVNEQLAEELHKPVIKKIQMKSILP